MVDDDFSEEFDEALRESEERFRTLFDQAPVGVFLFDRNLRITECNPRFVNVLGSTYEKLIGLDMRKLRDQSVLPAIERVLDGEPSSYEGPYVATTSERRIAVSMRLSPLRDALGGVVGGLGLVEDITERVRALEALRASEQRLSLHVKLSPLAVVVLTPTGTVLEWNESAHRIFGWKAEEVIGKPIPIVPESARAHVAEVASLLRQRRGGERSINENVRKDGRIILCDWVNTSLVDATGQVIGVASLVQDITEKNAAEDALKRSEARFRELIERAPEAIAVSRGGRYVYVNPAFVSYLGYDTAADLIGREAIDLVHPDDRELVAKPTSQRAPRREYRLLRRDGTAVTAEVASMHVDYDGAPALLAFARDVTERNEMQLRLLQADRMVSVGTLAAGVAHEVNNPLAYMIANLENAMSQRLPMLARHLEDAEASAREGVAADPRSLEQMRRVTEEMVEMLGIVREGAERVRTIVRDLKTFSRADEERLGPVDVRQVLDASISLAWNEIRHCAELVREYGHVPTVDANEARLGQVFLNLLLNAAQAIPPGRASENEIRVRTSTDARGAVRVEVTDTGSGIPESIVARIFDPFFTTKPVGVGTGLGLWICQGIVAACGGAITVERRKGSVGSGPLSRSGTTFVVSLPASASSDDRIVATPADLREEPEPARAHGGRVLIVDDEPAVAGALRNVLGEDHHVVVAASGREALALLEEDDAFDVVLCDLMMPDLTGIDLWEALRAKDRSIAERFVFITGGAFTSAAQEFFDRIDNPRVEKPFDVDALRALVRGRIAARVAP